MTDLSQLNVSFRGPVLIAVLAFMAACGGGGGSTGETPMVEDPVMPDLPPPSIPDIPDRPDLPDTGLAAQTREEGALLLAQFAGPSTLEYSELSSLPTTGTSDYEGYFYGDISNGSGITDTLIGDMNMRVGWTADSVTLSGDISDVVLENDTVTTGTLTISQGDLDRNGNPNSDFTLGGRIDGTLSGDGKTYIFANNPIEADFIGNSHNATGGEILGKVDVNGADQNFDGGFIVAR